MAGIGWEGGPLSALPAGYSAFDAGTENAHYDGHPGSSAVGCCELQISTMGTFFYCGRKLMGCLSPKFLVDTFMGRLSSPPVDKWIYSPTHMDLSGTILGDSKWGFSIRLKGVDS